MLFCPHDMYDPCPNMTSYMVHMGPEKVDVPGLCAIYPPSLMFKTSGLLHDFSVRTHRAYRCDEVTTTRVLPADHTT